MILQYPNSFSRLRSLCFVSLLGVFLAGCSFVSIDQKTRYRDAEGYFEPALLEQIKAEETSHTWLIKHFGQPWFSEVDGLEGYPEGVGIHTWRFEREQQKSTRVFLLFTSRKLNQQYEYLHVVTEGDMVKRAWRDDLATVDIRRLMAAMGYRKVQEHTSAAPAAPVQPESVAAPAQDTDSVPPPASLVVEDVPPPKPAEAEKAPAEPPPVDTPSNVTSL